METQDARTKDTRGCQRRIRVATDSNDGDSQCEGPRDTEPYEVHAEWILDCATRLGRRKGIPECDVDDFAGWVALRLLDRDCTVLKACRNPERMRGYLRTVIGNLLKDYRDHLWGKWRSSASARRLGIAAVELERLWQRDGFLLHEAIEILRTNHRRKESKEELENLASHLPQKTKKRLIPFDYCGPEGPSFYVVEQEIPDTVAWHRLSRRIVGCLGAAFASLETEDAEILRLHYEEGQSLATIARKRNLNQRALYSRRDRCLGKLRRILEEDGLNWQEISPLFTAPAQVP